MRVQRLIRTAYRILSRLIAQSEQPELGPVALEENGVNQSNALCLAVIFRRERQQNKRIECSVKIPIERKR